MTASAIYSPSVFLLIRSLNVGGAERQLIHLAKGLARRGCAVTVAVFYAGMLDHELIDAGIPLIDLRKTGRWDLWGFTLRLIKTLRGARADVLYSFLGTANILGAILEPLIPPAMLVWSVRASNMDLTSYDALARLSYNLERRLARRADLIISNSICGADFAVANGFPSDRMQVVENGIDTERFQPSAAARASVRAAWNVGANVPVIGVLARLDPMKGYLTFLEAAAKVTQARPEARFVVVGEGAPDERQRLETLAETLGLVSRVIFAGRSDRPAEALAGFDVYCSSSAFGEGFSNAIAEAMACGLPPVVTNVGDSAVIVGDIGRVVPPQDEGALANALISALDGLSALTAQAARQRIVDNYSVDRMVDRTLTVIAGSRGNTRDTSRRNSLSLPRQ